MESRAPRRWPAAGSSSSASAHETAAPAVEAPRAEEEEASPTTQDATPDAVGRGKRKREHLNYDEVNRRGAKRQRAVYLSVKGRRTGAKRDAIQAGVATLERTVGARYSWRDTNLTAAKRRRGRVLFECSAARPTRLTAPAAQPPPPAPPASYNTVES